MRDPANQRKRCLPTGPATFSGHGRLRVPVRERHALNVCRRKVRARSDHRTLVTAQRSDSTGRSVQLCHDGARLSSRSLLCALRRRGPPAPPADLPHVRPAVRDLRVLRPRPRLLLAAVPRGRPPAIGARRPGAPPAQPRRPSRPPRPPARLPCPAPPRDGSHYRAAATSAETPQPSRDRGFAACGNALRGLRPGEIGQVEPVRPHPAFTRSRRAPRLAADPP